MTHSKGRILGFGIWGSKHISDLLVTSGKKRGSEEAPASLEAANAEQDLTPQTPPANVEEPAGVPAKEAPNEPATEDEQEASKEPAAEADQEASKEPAAGADQALETPFQQANLSPDEAAETERLAQEMQKFPVSNIRGAGSTQDNRCNAIEINRVADGLRATHGISKAAALNGMGELIRRGGANASTPDTFKVTIKCPIENVDADISKHELVVLVTRHANGKNLRNLAEGMSGAIVRNGVYWATQGFALPGDLAKKIQNRLAYKKQPPLTAAEAAGCASYAQWLPDLDQLVGSERIKSLLAEDLELRKQGRSSNTTKGQSGQNQNQNKGKGNAQPGVKGKKNQGRKGQGGKGKNKGK